jgi:hypothetical protein
MRAPQVRDGLEGQEGQEGLDGREGQDGRDGQGCRVRLVGWAGLVVLLCVSAVSIASSRTFAQTDRPEMTRAPQFENDRAVSWKSVIPPHTESTLHRHDRYRTVVGVVGGELTTVDAQGRKTVTHYETGKSYWQEPMPPGAMHKDVNETGNTIELVVVEMK